MPPWGLNFDSPPAQSRKRRLFWRISRYRRQISPVSEVLLQFTHGQITSFSQDFLVLLAQLFPKESHCSGTCCVGNNSSPFAACPDAEFVSPTAGWPPLRGAISQTRDFPNCRSPHPSDNGNVELGIVLLHIAGPVLGAEFLDHRRDLFGVRNRNGIEFSFSVARGDPDRRVLEHVLIPLCVRASHRQQIQLVVVKYEPDRLRDGPSRLSASHSEVNFAIPREAVFQIALRRWHMSSCL